MLGDIHGACILLKHYAELYGVAAIFIIIYFESFSAPFPGETAVVAAEGDRCPPSVLLKEFDKACFVALGMASNEADRQFR